MSEGILMVLLWWFCITLIGLVTWPLSQRFFGTFKDQGYILSRGLGMVLVGFVNWIICSLHIIPFSVLSIVVSIAMVGTASWLLKKSSIKELLSFIKTQSRLVITVEVTFLLAFLLFTIVRMCNPDIAQTEKMPDFAFLSGITHSTFFPPEDPWFAGGFINYFYYGHYMVALLTKLSMVPTEYGYNLGVAVIFALTLLAAIGISYNLIKKVWYGVLGGLFVAFIGNLDCFFQLMSNLGEITSGQKKFYPFSWYNWWMSSRVIVREGIDVTINEFPFWSYILGDLHAHMNVVPMSLLLIAIVLEFFRSAGNGMRLLGKTTKDSVFRLVIACIALGAIPCANTWDVPTYFALLPIAILIGRQFSLETGGIFPKTGEPTSVSVFQIVLSPLIDFKNRLFKKNTSGLKQLFLSWAVIILLITGAVVLYYPFHHNFHPVGTDGPEFLNAEQRTLIDDFLTIYGFFFNCIIPMVIAWIYPQLKAMNDRLRPLVGIGLLFLFMALLLVFDRFMIAICLLLLFAILSIKLRNDDPEVKNKFFVLAILITALLIILGCEFIYLKDAYGHPLERQNTVFKFYYQAWIFFALGSGYAVYWMRTKANQLASNIWEPGFRILFLAVLMFPLIATSVKTNYLKAIVSPTTHAKATLDGIHYMSWQYKGDHKAIHWLRDNASPDQRILEACGPAFSHYGRISAGTGMKTILGWANHENIWRDGEWKIVGARKSEIQSAYTSANQETIKRILDKYDIDYVYYGKLEREQYKQSSPDHFRFLEKVMEVKDTDQKMTYLYRYNRTAQR